MLKNLVRYAGLPFIFIFPMTLYGVASTYGHAPAWAIGSAIVGLCILLYWEKYLPSRQEWKPTWGHLKLDVQYLTIVHMVFPDLLGAGISLFLVQHFGTKGVLTAWWPHAWPVWGQVLLLVLLADVLMYWVHRALHTVPVLWRLHALHHSVDRLYVLNGSRFHPIEVLMRYLVQSLPFMLLGVDPRVFGFWVLLHILIAFSQHCNIDFYFGRLNKIVITPELHRWHHSIHIHESNANYATSFCFWDMLFGTYFCPDDRYVGKLGVEGLTYPPGFLAQLAEPFKNTEQ